MDRITHPFTPEEVMAYLDGELSPERATAAAAHLEHCAECRALAQEIRGVSRQLASWQVEAAPDHLSESAIRAAASPMPPAIQVKSAKREETKVARRLLPRPALWWGSALAIGAVMLIAVTIPSLQRSSSSARLAERTTRLSGPVQTTSVAPAAPDLQDRRVANEPAATSAMMTKKDRDATAAYASRSAPSPVMDQKAKVSATPASLGPIIIRHASIALLTKEFDSARAAMENLVRAHQGYFGQLNVTTPANAGRTLIATVRVPAAQLDPALVELRKLGRVEQENQSADDVTGQYVDLTARLSNARETEKRLVEILRERTGKVADVLDVEREISGVRQQIEQMDAQRKTMENQVQYASVDLRITEEFKQSLEAPVPSLGTRIHNAAVEGFLAAADLVIGLLLFLLNAGPTLMLLAATLAWPAWRGMRWVRRRLGLAGATSQTA
jgi:hypothetical protein